MLANTLNNNEIKNSAGTEVEFQRISQGPGRETIFAIIGENPSLPHRLTIKHTETGVGINAKRRSLVRFDKGVISTVDATKAVTCTDYWVHEVPIGALQANTEPANVVAELMSFMASLGASTTILYDGTGNGAREVLNGGL